MSSLDPDYDYTSEEIKKIAELNSPTADTLDFSPTPRRGRMSRSQFRRAKAKYEQEFAQYKKDMQEYKKQRADRKAEKAATRKNEKPKSGKANQYKFQKYGFGPTNLPETTQQEDGSSKSGRYDPVSVAMERGYYEYDDNFSKEANEKIRKQFIKQSRQQRYDKLNAIDPEAVFAKIREDFGPDAEDYARRQANARIGESRSLGMYTPRVDYSKGYNQGTFNPMAPSYDMKRAKRDRANEQIKAFRDSRDGIDKEGGKYYIPWWKQSGVIRERAQRKKISSRNRARIEAEMQAARDKYSKSGASSLPTRGRRSRF